MRKTIRQNAESTNSSMMLPLAVGSAQGPTDGKAYEAAKSSPARGALLLWVS
jgi:hypothetical protein